MEIKTRPAKQLATDRPVTWQLGYLEAAVKEARRYLDDDQYAHVVGLFDELASEDNPRASKSQSVRQVDDFFELREKGGILGNINFRVYFIVDDETKFIIVLGCDKKEGENKIAPHMTVRMRNRGNVARLFLQKNNV